MRARAASARRSALSRAAGGPWGRPARWKCRPSSCSLCHRALTGRPARPCGVTARSGEKALAKPPDTVHSWPGIKSHFFSRYFWK
eukprot:3225336-Prymnesium_polylepis.1